MVDLQPLHAAEFAQPRPVEVLQPRSARFGAGLDRALATLATWRADGSIRPAGSGWWAQHVRGDDVDVVGLLAVIDVTSRADARLLPHERVFDEPVARRVRLRQRLGVEPRPSLVLLPDGVAREAVDPLRAAFDGNEPTRTDSAGRTQRVARLPDPVGDALARQLRDTPALLADGHHRVAAAQHPDAPNRGTTFALVVPSGQHRMLWPVHRILLRLRVDDPLAGARAAGFRLEPTRPTTPGPHDPPILVTGEGAFAVVEGPPRWNEGLPPLTHDLPVSLAHALASALGAGDRRDALGTAHEAEEALTAVADGAPAAILVGGPTPAQVWEAARSGVRLPPKATSFHPKPVGGFLMRLVDETRPRTGP